MEYPELSHDERGGGRVLAVPWIYSLFAKIIGRARNRVRLVHEFIKPFPGCRILDIGCGPADLLAYLPDSIGEYVGFDMNAGYIEAARKQWREKPNCSFFCQTLRDATMIEKSSYDIVLALGIVHHLDDRDALRLFALSLDLLKPGGVLITYDGAYVDNQNPLAKWLISKDRGKAVRTSEGYSSLARQSFPDTVGYLLHDTLKVPYTIFLMKCHKAS